jgi:hypothetical protein
MRFEALLDRHERRELSEGEAAEMLGSQSEPSGAGATDCAMRSRQG